MSTIKKECDVIILPSDKESILSVWGNEEYPMDELFLSTPQNRNKFDEKELQYVNIYILSNNRIYKDDYYFLDGKISKQPTELINIDVQLFSGAKKVIATTDRLNIHPNISDSYRSGNCVPRIKDSFIDRFIESYNRGECIESVIINFEQYDFAPDNSMGYFEPGAFTYKLRPEINDIDNTINILL
jgi:hypothetical protein